MSTDYYKYKKYKSKYIKLNRLSSDKKMGIVMLCMLKDHYVLGACIAAYTHKYLLKKANIGNTDLVIMCDQYIYDKYQKLLSYYFDLIKLIKLVDYSKSNEYVMVNPAFTKKYSWITMSTNKWQCLQYEEYDKIVFIDIDILPVSTKFYELFNFETPAFRFHINTMDADAAEKFLDTCVDKTKTNNLLDKFNTYYEYTKSKAYSIDGGIMVLKPRIKDYEEYAKFTEKQYANGMYSSKVSGADETSLFWFYSKILKANISRICNEYSVIPWKEQKYYETAVAYNYLSQIKPWNKNLFLSWPEEVVWRNIYDKMEHRGNIEELFKNIIVDYFNEYVKMDYYTAKKYYNMDYVKKYSNKISDIKNKKDVYNGIINLEKEIYKHDGYGVIKLKDINDLVNSQS